MIENTVNRTAERAEFIALTINDDRNHVDGSTVCKFTAVVADAVSPIIAHTATHSSAGKDFMCAPVSAFLLLLLLFITHVRSKKTCYAPSFTREKTIIDTMNAIIHVTTESARDVRIFPICAISV